MLRPASVITLAVVLASAGHGQGTASRDAWPRAIQPPTIGFEADYAIALNGNVTGYAPSIVSSKPKSVGFKEPHLSDIQGVLHASPARIWTREVVPNVPWDAISVVTAEGNAIDGHDADFQIDGHSKMHIEPTGLLDQPGTMGLFVGEGIGWCKLSLNGSAGARTWLRFLEMFTPEPVQKVGGEAIYRGKSGSGWTVSIRTDLAGTQLRAIELRNTTTMNALRQVVFHKWETVEGTVLPTEGELNYSFAMDQGAAPTETTRATFEISNIRPGVTAANPPWVNGMQFRTMVLRHDRLGGMDTSSFKLVNGKLFPMEDPGNVFKEPTGNNAWVPYVVGVGLLGIGVLAVALSRRRRKDASAN